LYSIILRLLGCEGKRMKHSQGNYGLHLHAGGSVGERSA